MSTCMYPKGTDSWDDAQIVESWKGSRPACPNPLLRPKNVRCIIKRPLLPSYVRARDFPHACSSATKERPRYASFISSMHAAAAANLSIESSWGIQGRSGAGMGAHGREKESTNG